MCIYVEIYGYQNIDRDNYNIYKFWNMALILLFLNVFANTGYVAIKSKSVTLG